MGLCWTKFSNLSNESVVIFQTRKEGTVVKDVPWKREKEGFSKPVGYKNAIQISYGNNFDPRLS